MVTVGVFVYLASLSEGSVVISIVGRREIGIVCTRRSFAAFLRRRGGRPADIRKPETTAKGSGRLAAAAGGGGAGWFLAVFLLLLISLLLLLLLLPPTTTVAVMLEFQ